MKTPLPEIALLAQGFAMCAHRNLPRKHEDLPYVVHCERVARTVAEYTDDANVIAAAFMHDVLEDIRPWPLPHKVAPSDYAVSKASASAGNSAAILRHRSKGTGTGLGLSLARRIAEEHRGRIEVSSEVGKGTKFL